MESNFKALVQLIVITLLLTAGVGVFSFSSSRADSVIVYVNTAYPYPTGDGTANRPYRTIQQGIDAANPGDSIYLFKGLYNETLTINKEVTILSDDRENTTIYWGGKSNAYLIEITADLVSLEDLNITDPSNKIRTALIHVVADYARLVGVRVTHGRKWGVYLDGSDDNTIGFSRFDNSSSDSIHAVASSNNVFTNN
ncbi:MAG: DUF1565 domain-containing protein, partial [Candidatus Thermoplasmatota archaeon]|nr:DUF1565 domain-containing protein [Candidatus Thermoplasmatota archaeon]